MYVYDILNISVDTIVKKKTISGEDIVSIITRWNYLKFRWAWTRDFKAKDEGPKSSSHKQCVSKLYTIENNVVQLSIAIKQFLNI